MGGKNQTSTSNSSQSYTPTGLNQLQDIWNKVQGVASTPYTPYGGQLTAGLDPTQQGGINTINNAQGTAQPYYDQATQYANQAAAPISADQIQRYQSPYTQQVVNAAQNQFNDSNAQQQQQVVGNAALRGALGGDRVGVAQAELARQQKLAQDPTIAGLYNQGYTQALGAAQQDRAAQGQAAYSLGSLGSAAQNTAISGGNAQLGAGAVAQGTNQAGLSAQYQQYLQQQAFPYQQAQFLTQYGLPAVTAQGGSQTGTSQTTQPGPSPFAQLGGLGISALAAYSDERVKKNIDEIGKTFDGQPIYRFEYKGSNRPQIGLMAQDVEKTRPEAVGSVGGIKTVDYRKATEGAAQKGSFARGGAVDYLSVPSFIPDSDPKISDLTRQMTPMSVPQPQQSGGGQSGFGMPTGQNLKDMTAGFKGLGGLFGDSGVSPGNIGGTGLPGFGGLYSLGGAVSPSPFVQGYALGGDIPLADRFAPVQEAVSSGTFDPQGENYTPFSPAPVAQIPLPQPRPDVAPTMVADQQVPPMAATRPQAPMAIAPETMEMSAREKPKSESAYGGFNPLGLSDDARTGLMAAGLGIAASRSPFALSAIGEGGLQGMQTYMGQKKERADKEIQKQRVDQEAQRLAQSAEQFSKTFGLHKEQFGETQRQRRTEELKPIKIGTDVTGKDIYAVRDPDSGSFKVLDQNGNFVKQDGDVPASAIPQSGISATSGAVAPVEVRATADPGSARARNEEFMADLTKKNPGYAAQVKAAADYTLDPNKTFSMRNNIRDQFLRNVFQYDPTYDSTTFPARNKAVSGFASGPLANQIRSFDVSISHLSTLEDLAKNLNNTQSPAWNKVANYFKQQFGKEAPGNFDAAKSIVADEIAKGIIGGQTALGDREDLQRRLDKANSPEQLAGVVRTFKQLLGGQLHGLKKQYEDTTKLHNFDERLTPATRDAISNAESYHKPKGDEGGFTGRTASGPKGQKLRETSDGKWVP